MIRRRTLLVVTLVAVALMIAACTGGQTGDQGDAPAYQGKTLTLSSPPWPGGTMKSHVLEEALEKRLEITVELTNLDGPVSFQALENEEVDAFVEAWLPQYFGDVAEKTGESYENLGPNYHNAIVAYGVPTYTAESHNIETLSDLQDNSELFDRDGNGKGDIYTIKPGSQYAKQADKDVSNILPGFEVKPSSTAGMTTELEKAVNNEEPILITSWKPLWIHSRWDITHLQDDTDQSALSNFNEHIDMLVRNGFKDEFGSSLYNILDRVRFDGQTSKMMLWKQQGKTAKQSAHQWVTENGDVIDAWFEEGADDHEWGKHIGNEDREDTPDNIREMWQNGEVDISQE